MSEGGAVGEGRCCGGRALHDGRQGIGGDDDEVLHELRSRVARGDAALPKLRSRHKLGETVGQRTGGCAARAAGECSDGRTQGQHGSRRSAGQCCARRLGMEVRLGFSAAASAVRRLLRQGGSPDRLRRPPRHRLLPARHRRHRLLSIQHEPRRGEACRAVAADAADAARCTGESGREGQRRMERSRAREG